MSAVGDARKRHAEQHHTHHDAATRELIAAAEARGAERALREAADSFAEHRDWAYPYLVECQQWLRARADQIGGTR